jgi:hypothetical protein
MDYRFKEDIDVISFPKGFIEEDRSFKECCDPFLVLADAISSDSYKNDLELAYIKKGLVSDAVTFTIEDCSGTILPNLGTVAVFPNDLLAVGFIYDWQQYLQTYGPNIYVIKVNFTIAGITSGFTWGQFDLRPYSIGSAKGTVRIRSEFNSYYLKEAIDFTDSNCISTIRFKGFFGKRLDLRAFLVKGSLKLK